MYQPKFISFNEVDILRIFYFLSLIVTLETLVSYTYSDYNTVATTQMYLYKWIPDTFDLNKILSFICPFLMMLFIFLFLFLSRQSVRVIWAILFFLIDGFSFSYVLSHKSHMYIWIHLFFALIPGKLSTTSAPQLLQPFIRVAQWQILLIYGLSGYWKIRAVIESFSNTNIVSGFDYVPYAMAWEMVNSNKFQAASMWIIEHPLLCLLLSIFVLVAHLGSILIIFFPQFYFFWGIVLALFHVGTLMTVNVFFDWSVFGIILFLCLYNSKKTELSL